MQQRKVASSVLGVGDECDADSIYRGRIGGSGRERLTQSIGCQSDSCIDPSGFRPVE